MVKKKLISFIFIIFLFIPQFSFGSPNLDQWLDTEKTYKDLIDDGYEVKSYSISDIKTANGLMLILFVTVLQKDKEIYECQEYQTIDKMIETFNMQLICKQLVQPYERGLGT